MNQPMHHRTEGSKDGSNYIDHMYINAALHVFHPKVSLDGGYTGDGLLLCDEVQYVRI